MKNPVVTLFEINLMLRVWCVYITFDLCPLVWMVGASYEGPDDDAATPGSVVTFCVPTMRLEIRWATHEKMDALADKLERAGLLDCEESPS